jgi:hypothetical protein
MGFPRSESSFVAVLGLHSTPGYFSDENEPNEKDSFFHHDPLVQACQSV